MFDVPGAALEVGFENRMLAVCSSRTIMLPELRRLLAARASDAPPGDYRRAVVEDNVLLKPTRDTRTKTLQYLRQRYLLDRGVALFRALRDLWSADETAQPLLALLAASARDPLLRATAETVLPLPVGAAVSPDQFAAAIARAFPDRFGAKTLLATAQRVASSWQQSGHLAGRAHKVRARAASRPEAVAYALLLGHLCGVRGDALFATRWTRMLDAPGHVLRAQAADASRLGWIEFRHAGGVTDVGFRHLLREEGGDAA